jgi:SAM-dependent methyltransferase
VKQYSGEFRDDSAHGHSYQLLARAGVESGLVIDLGSASGPLAEPVAGLGFDYVGADIDRAALDELAGRGFEAHELDLRLDEDALLAALSSIAAGRAVAAVLMLDVIEHLVDPGPVLRAAARLGEGGSGAPLLIVSIPNVTHVDIAAKLLVGRWDLTKIGLLDDTHVRFYTDRRVRDTLAGAGWSEVDAYDVLNPFSDQMFPVDAPVLRPGTPLRQLLSRVRTTADPFGETYQYVRRYEHAVALDSRIEPPPVDIAPVASTPILSVIVRVTGATDGRALAGDLVAQTDQDFELVVSHDPSAEGPSALDDADLGVNVVRVKDEADWRNAAIAVASGRYLGFVDDRTRLAPGYVDTIRQGADALPARVVQTSAYQLSGRQGSDPVAAVPFDELVDGLSTVDLDPLDLVTTRPFGSVVLAAHAVPRAACTVTGLRFASAAGFGPASLFLLRAVEMCGIARFDQGLCAVEPGAVRELAADLLYLRDELGRDSLVLPEGAGSQLLHLREALVLSVAERDQLASRLAAADEQVGALSALVRQHENEVVRGRTRTRARRAGHEHRLSTKVRRRIGRLARRI